jgi:hypothetical protein
MTNDLHDQLDTESVANDAIEPLTDEVLEYDSEISEGKEEAELQEVREKLGVTDMVDPLRALLDAPVGPVTSGFPVPRLNTEFQIKALTSREYNAIQERSTRFTRNKRTGRMDRDLDATTMSLLVCLAGTVHPNFQDSQLTKRYPNMQPHEIVATSLLPGEVDNLATKILSLSGFDEELEDTGKD